ncbi:MAG: type II toxin-antitoxin system RelE/ParE family toxin [Nitrospirota bacterium]|nr:type II toxin-antitoxin system RelE/ParE family toxin [Nitrospirota bacterium]MDX2420592.1 type II toxin-antitoxin system RelE/ParE family toxin [Nitrospirota bacterium]
MRKVYWVKAADKDFRKFPQSVQEPMHDVLAIAAEGQKADAAKPMKGLGSGVFEIALSYKTDAYRAIYAVQLGEDIWVIHAFQKKAKYKNETPKQEVDLIKERIRRLKEMLR